MEGTQRGSAPWPTVVDHLGDRHQGSLALLCIGDRLTGLGGRIGATLAAAPLRRCRLQMMQTAPTTERLATAIADADSMRYYPAFDLPGAHALPPPGPETARWAMQLLLVQRAGGGLTIGDTHVYDEPFDFAVDESVYDCLRHRAESILGWELPPVVRRWAGVYTAATDDRICFRQEVDARRVGGHRTGRARDDPLPRHRRADLGRGDRMTTPIRLVALDMAGTTVADGGAVEEAFQHALDVVGLTAGQLAADPKDYVRRTMGQSKITVFSELLGGDRHRAEQANSAFEDAFDRAVDRGEVCGHPRR